MSLATLSSKELARVQRLVEQKEALVQQVADINSELGAIESGVSESVGPASPAPSPAATRPVSARRAAARKPAKAAAPAIPRKKAKTGQTGRGELRDRITGQLKAAGKAGIKVKDLAAKLGTNYGNITAFFQSTGKKITEIKKVGPAHYAWTGA